VKRIQAREAWIACALLLGVFIRHEGIYWIAGASGYTPQATAYMLGGMLEALLWAVVLTFARGFEDSIWRDLMLTASTIGILEGLQTTGCRLAVSDISRVPRGTSLCEFVVGFQIGHTMFAVYLLFVLWIIGRWACRVTR
jgi:hypothetical protein